jgi:hypothetical protein
MGQPTEAPDTASSGIEITNNILRLLYGTMLLRFDNETIRNFWNTHPLALDKKAALSEEDFFSHIWEEKQTTPLSYVIDVLNSVEPWLQKSSVPPMEFIDHTYTTLNRGSIFTPGVILSIAKPFLALFFKTADIRYLILEKMSFWTKPISPEIVHTCHCIRDEEEWWRAIILLIHDSTFSQRYPAYDVELWAAKPVQFAPYRLSCPPYEQCLGLAKK